MGISTNVYTIYGWHFETVPEDLYNHLEEMDNYPDGFIADMDFTSAHLGVVLFDSGDARWGEMYGSVTWDSAQAEDALTKWKEENRDIYPAMLQLAGVDEKDVKYHSFVNYS